MGDLLFWSFARVVGLAVVEELDFYYCEWEALCVGSGPPSLIGVVVGNRELNLWSIDVTWMDFLWARIIFVVGCQ